MARISMSNSMSNCRYLMMPTQHMNTPSARKPCSGPTVSGLNDYAVSRGNCRQTAVEGGGVWQRNITTHTHTQTQKHTHTNIY